MGGFVHAPAMTGAITLETKGPSNVLTRIRKNLFTSVEDVQNEQEGETQRHMKNQIVLVMQQDLHLMKTMKLER